MADAVFWRPERVGVFRQTQSLSHIMWTHTQTHRVTLCLLLQGPEYQANTHTHTHKHRGNQHTAELHCKINCMTSLYISSLLSKPPHPRLISFSPASQSLASVAVSTLTSQFSLHPSPPPSLTHPSDVFFTLLERNTGGKAGKREWEEISRYNMRRNQQKES